MKQKKTGLVLHKYPPPPAVWKCSGVTLRNEQKQGKLLETSQPNPRLCKLIFLGLKIQKVLEK